MAFTDADVKRIAALPAALQVEEVRKGLKKRNPEFDGTLTPTIQNGDVTDLQFTTDHVKDISPVRALVRLRRLLMMGTQPGAGSLADLSPLKGMSLNCLNLMNNNVSDLTPLRGMKLERLMLWSWWGSDLTPLEGMPLKWLNCGGRGQRLDLTPLVGAPLESLCVNLTQVSDLAPLKDMPLTDLLCQNTLVSDLAPLRGMRLQRLHIANSKVSDLAPVKGMPLNSLFIKGTSVIDLAPLKDLPLVEIWCDFQAPRDAKILRAIRDAGDDQRRAGEAVLAGLSAEKDAAMAVVRDRAPSSRRADAVRDQAPRGLHACCVNSTVDTLSIPGLLTSPSVGREASRRAMVGRAGNPPCGVKGDGHANASRLRTTSRLRFTRSIKTR